MNGRQITTIRRPFLMAARLLLVLLPLAAHAQGSNAPIEAHRGGTLSWGIETEPTTLNPHLNTQAKTKLVLRNLFESLLARDADGGYVPWLATGHQVSADGKAYTFTLRDDVHFSDGEPFTAQAVALNFERIRTDPAYTSNLNARPISYLAEARALDARTVEFSLNAPYTPFLAFAASLELISPKSFASAQLRSGGVEIAGTGPFVLSRYVRGQEIELERNPDYRWPPANAAHQGPAYLDALSYRILPESAVRVGALSSGQVDVIEGISGNDADLFLNDPAFSYQHALNSGTPLTLFFNTERGPTRDIRVRQALIHALDPDALLESIYRGQRTRAWGILSPTDRGLYDPSIEQRYGVDLERANRLLDEAGWEARDAEGLRIKEGVRLTVELIQSPATLRDQRDVLLQALQAQARQNAGIDLRPVLLDAGSFLERRDRGDYGAIANSTTPAGDGLAIEWYYLPRDQAGGNNFARTQAPELARWLGQAAISRDGEQRFGLYAALQRFALLDQALGLPLYVPEDQIAAAAYVHGLGFRPYLQLPENAYAVWLDPQGR